MKPESGFSQRAKETTSPTPKSLASQTPRSMSRASSLNLSFPDMKAKVIVLGDPSVGKTTVLQHLRTLASADREKTDNAECTSLENCFSTRRRLDCVETTVTDQHGRTVQLKVHDTLGQERYRSLTASYYRDALACIIFFDTASEESFTNIPHWLKDLKMYCGGRDVVTMMVGTMSKSGDRSVSRERSERMAAEHQLYCMDVNKDSDINISILFNQLAELVIEKIINLGQSREYSKLSDRPVALEKSQPPNKTVCCQC